LKETKARSQHLCYKCGKNIFSGETYYCEDIKDKFLHNLHAKKYCSICYEKYGNSLLSLRVETSNKGISSLEKFYKR
jgi:hypothetical protein